MERAGVKEPEDENRRLRMEQEFLRKGRGLLRADAAVAERCAVIEAKKANYEIVWMCRLLDVPGSSLDAWRNRVETPTAARRRWLAELVGTALLGLRAMQPRAYKRTTVPGEYPVQSPDLIGRDFAADQINRKCMPLAATEAPYRSVLRMYASVSPPTLSTGVLSSVGVWGRWAVLVASDRFGVSWKCVRVVVIAYGVVCCG
jgi:hypothetical protein